VSDVQALLTALREITPEEIEASSLADQLALQEAAARVHNLAWNAHTCPGRSRQYPFYR
jgi:hypothetical protein